MKKICILIPTYMRPNYIEEWLEFELSKCILYGIDIHIFDSSINDVTKKTVKKYYCNNLYYNNYISNDNTPDKKVFDALKILSNRYDYIWLCGDGILLNIENIFNYDLFDKSYDLIHLCDNTNNIKNINLPLNSMIYTNVQCFVRDFLHSFTLYGATIISSNLAKRLTTEIDFDKYKNSGFYPQFAILSLFKMDCLFKVILGNFYQDSAAKTFGGNGSYKPGCFFPLWVYSWKHTIDLLPDTYNEIKKSMYKNESAILFSRNGVIQLRCSHNLSFKIIRKYKSELKVVSDCGLFRFYLMALIPIPFLKVLKSIYYKCFKRS